MHVFNMLKSCHLQNMLVLTFYFMKTKMFFFCKFGYYLYLDVILHTNACMYFR